MGRIHVARRARSDLLRNTNFIKSGPGGRSQKPEQIHGRAVRGSGRAFADGSAYVCPEAAERGRAAHHRTCELCFLKRTCGQPIVECAGNTRCCVRRVGEWRRKAAAGPVTTRRGKAASGSMTLAVAATAPLPHAASARQHEAARLCEEVQKMCSAMQGWARRSEQAQLPAVETAASWVILRKTEGRLRDRGSRGWPPSSEATKFPIC